LHNYIMHIDLPDYFTRLRWEDLDVGDLVWLQPTHERGCIGCIYMGVHGASYSKEIVQFSIMVEDSIWITSNNNLGIGYGLTLHNKTKMRVMKWWPSIDSYDKWVSETQG